MWEFHRLDRTDPSFDDFLKSLTANCRSRTMPCDGIREQCIATVTPRGRRQPRSRLKINTDYVATNMVHKCEYLLLMRRPGDRGYFEYGGFLLCRQVTQLGVPTLYIDLICSAHRMGGVLLEKAETLAREIGLTSLSLRAASPPLLQYYRKRQFARHVPYSSDMNAREWRQRRRELDKTAATQWSGSQWQVSGDGWLMVKQL